MQLATPWMNRGAFDIQSSNYPYPQALLSIYLPKRFRRQFGFGRSRLEVRTRMPIEMSDQCQHRAIVQSKANRFALLEIQSRCFPMTAVDLLVRGLDAQGIHLPNEACTKIYRAIKEEYYHDSYVVVLGKSRQRSFTEIKK